MALAKITKKLIEGVEVPEKGTAVIWDSSPGMQGFGIRVSSSGRVSFVVRYWTGEREQWKTLGAYPRLTLTKAREDARDILREASTGGDPVAEEKAAKEAAEKAKEAADTHTVEALSDEWLAYLPSHVTRSGRRISPKTVEQYESCMRVHIVPELGSKPVTEVTKGDVRKLHTHVTREGGDYIANRVVSVLSIFYGWLDNREAVPPKFNPARRPPRNPEQTRGAHAAVRLSPDQEGRLVRAIYALINGTERTDKNGDTYKHSDPVGGVALLTLLDTGRRKGEVLGMQWERLDLDAGTADLGATKGKKEGDVCYLSARVCEAIRNLPRIVGSKWVFTGDGDGNRRRGLQSAWEGVKADAGLEEISPDLEGFHLHDLRHHRISEWLAAGISPQLIKEQVGHTSLDQLEVYAHVNVKDVAAVLSKLQPVGPAPESEEIGADR